MNLEEGVIKFRQEFRDGILPELRILRELNFWRNILHKEGLIGRNPEKYGGFGYGNVSQRLEPHLSSANKRRFVITGSQTQNLLKLEDKDYVIVHEYHPEENFVIAGGVIQASSESMTHGELYNLDNSIRAVFHSHSSPIWRNSEYLGIPTTRENIAYGTPEMAEEVRRLYRETNMERVRIFSMGGHEDGIFAFGANAREAGYTLLRYLFMAKKLASSQ